MACFRPSCASETTSREERRPERTILRRPDIDAQHLAFACGRRTGTTWQRCRVHFMRNLLATVPQGAREPIAAVVRTIFAQPDHATALTQLRKVAEGLRARFARTSTLLEEAAEDILAYRHLPLEHQRQLHSTDAIDKPFYA
jgi:putative transposase